MIILPSEISLPTTTPCADGLASWKRYWLRHHHCSTLRERRLIKFEFTDELVARCILLALVERGGEIVSKEKLIAQAWPNTFVDEAALRVHVAAIRKVPGGGSGARYVENRC